jgi:hypothetical protein
MIAPDGGGGKSFVSGKNGPITSSKAASEGAGATFRTAGITGSLKQS